jgi:hypothetical protein
VPANALRLTSRPDPVKRLLLRGLARAGVLRPVFRSYERVQALLATGRDGNGDLPPARLRVRVAGTADLAWFLEGGRLAAEAVDAYCATGDGKALATARKRFMRTHGQVFWILGVMQRYWYSTDDRRERFVSICRDVDVQQLTFDAYMNKELVKARPLAHARIFFKNIAHLMGLVPA